MQSGGTGGFPCQRLFQQLLGMNFDGCRQDLPAQGRRAFFVRQRFQEPLNSLPNICHRVFPWQPSNSGHQASQPCASCSITTLTLLVISTDISSLAKTPTPRFSPTSSSEE